MPDETSDVSQSTTVKLLAAMLVKDLPLAEGAPILSQLGVGNSDIAAVYGTTPSSVRGATSRANRSPKKSNGTK